MYLYKFCVMLSRRLPQKYKEKKQKKPTHMTSTQKKLVELKGIEPST